MKFGKRAAYSPRSAVSIREEERLQAEIDRYAALEKNVEAEISRLEKDKEANLELVARGHSDRGLSDVLAKLEDGKRKLDAYGKAVEASQSTLAKFRDEVAAEAEKRSKRQTELAGLVRTRVRKDELIDAALASLRKLLNDRQALTEGIGELGRELEFYRRDWDGERFTALLPLLPETILERSKEWVAWFLGEKSANHLKAYVVCAKDGATVPETLAHSGMLHFGDTVCLREEDARELLRYDRRNPAWRPNYNDDQTKFFSPSLMPEGEWTELQAEAVQTGQSVDTVLFLRVLKRQRELDQEAERPEIVKQSDSQEAVGFPA